MSSTLHWDELHLGHAVIPANSVHHGELVRLVMDYPCQLAFMQNMFQLDGRNLKQEWNMWLQSGEKSFPAATPEFSRHIGSMIRGRGLIANLTLRENLLLPFLYHANRQQLQQAEDEIIDVAQWLGLTSAFDEKAGERTTYTHALISLARCLLIKPSIIVAHEVHIGMPPEQLERFKSFSTGSLAQLGSGLLYLTESMDEGSGLDYSRSLIITPDCQTIGSGEET